MVACAGTSTPSDTDPLDPTTSDSGGATELTPWDEPDEPDADAGRVVLHRLNNEALERSVQALFASELTFADTLPANGEAYGFDNNAAAQSLSMLHLETIESAVDTVIADSMRPPVEREIDRSEAESEAWSSGGGVDWCGTWTTRVDCRELWFTNTATLPVNIENAGTYRFRVRACQAYNTVPPTLLLSVDGVEVDQLVVTAACREDSALFDEVQTDVVLEPGLFDIAVGLQAETGVKMFAFDWMEVEGPLEADGALPPGRARLYSCDPEADDSDGGGDDSGAPDTATTADSGGTDSAADDTGESEAEGSCARTIVSEFLAEAWRRPVTEDEIDRVMVVLELELSGSGDVHAAIQVALKRAVLSPHFLFQVETPPAPDTQEAAPLSAHELATRLSYFLWSRHPDAELRAVTDDGSLLEPAVLEAQTRRMLSAPEADALVAGFGAQWLGLPALASASPDPDTYPVFDEPLRDAMTAEILTLLERVLLEDQSMLEVLVAEETWVEPRLAEHYGLDAMESGALLVVPERAGGGLLTMAGFLTATSNPTRTSPVRRGAWVASHLLCEEPPPPPDGVEQEIDGSGEAGTVAEQLAEHRADPSCAACHDLIDPIGLSLEGFDGLGTARTTYADGTPVETNGQLVGVGEFDGVPELTAALAQDGRVPRCMTQRLFTYALGRGTRPKDWPYIAPIEQAFVASDHHFTELVLGVVLSEPFRTHRGEP